MQGIESRSGFPELCMQDDSEKTLPLPPVPPSGISARASAQGSYTLLPQTWNLETQTNAQCQKIKTMKLGLCGTGDKQPDVGWNINALTQKPRMCPLWTAQLRKTIPTAQGGIGVQIVTPVLRDRVSLIKHRHSRRPPPRCRLLSPLRSSEFPRGPLRGRF